jgi:dihydroorotate dehydrogenase
VGVNVGKNKLSSDAVADYRHGIRAFTTNADYLVVNISSPNTPGLRALQGRAPLRELLLACVEERDIAAKRVASLEGWRGPPLLVKIAPDMDDEGLRAVVEECLACGVDGIIVSNTTVERPASLRSEHRVQPGGLSGAPLRDMSTEMLRRTYALTQGRIPLVGVGGISSGRDAYEKILAGADTVQLYTALAFAGPSLVRRIKRELAACLEADGYASVQDAVGKGVPLATDRA